MGVGALILLILAAGAVGLAASGGLRRPGVKDEGPPPPRVLPPLADAEFAAELAEPAAQGFEEEPDFPVEQPEAQDDLTDIPNGAMPRTASAALDSGLELPAAEEVAEAPVEPEGPGTPVTAIPRNPQSLYVSWERPERGEARLRAVLGPDRFQATVPCLRAFDLQSDRHLAVDLGEEDDHCFLQGLEPGHRYVVTIERRSPEGLRYLLALSPPVSTVQGTGQTVAHQ